MTRERLGYTFDSGTCPNNDVYSRCPRICTRDVPGKFVRLHARGKEGREGPVNASQRGEGVERRCRVG